MNTIIVFKFDQKPMWVPSSDCLHLTYSHFKLGLFSTLKFFGFKQETLSSFYVQSTILCTLYEIEITRIFIPKTFSCLKLQQFSVKM